MSTEDLSEILRALKEVERKQDKQTEEFHLYLNGDAVNDIPGTPERIRQLRAELHHSRDERIKEVEALWEEIKSLKSAGSVTWQNWISFGAAVAGPLIVYALLKPMGA